MMNGGNVLVLQRVLGHANLTMRYAHLAPDHLLEVVKLNPLTAVDTSLTLGKKSTRSVALSR